MASLYCRGDATKEHCRRSLCPSVTCVFLFYPRMGDACGRNNIHWGVRCRVPNNGSYAWCMPVEQLLAVPLVAIRETGPQRAPLLGYMIPDPIADLLKGCFSRRNVTERVEKHEVVNGAVVPDSGHRDASCLQFSCVGLAFVA